MPERYATIDGMAEEVAVSYIDVIAQERAGSDRDGHNHELLFRATLQLSEQITSHADAAERRGDAIDAVLARVRDVLGVQAA